MESLTDEGMKKCTPKKTVKLLHKQKHNACLCVYSFNPST